MDMWVTTRLGRTAVAICVNRYPDTVAIEFLGNDEAPWLSWQAGFFECRLVARLSVVTASRFAIAATWLKPENFDDLVRC